MHHHHDDYYDLEADRASVSSSERGTRATHHHHVPQNPFLSLGVQTSLAISLHKLPEGFITFAANHANPRLGLSVFMSLFIHNICEGLAMALPLFLALRSRAKAMTWASILGGITQPFGAALAALWFWGSQDAYGKVTHSHDAPAAGETALMYGIIFSITAGIMTNVGMQLFAEATSLTHCHTACVKFALGGMVLLGLGQALLE
ncbi:hypothetical protein KEM55_008697 [Ascosphaera atra]|nr:hypothetical protein KEM55_008697 [Ascosphaera atra]